VVDTPDSLKFIHKWIWREIEVNKAKFDELCAPLFDIIPHELSPAAHCFIIQSKEFFLRASKILEFLTGKIGKFGQQGFLFPP
jgi:hypothetical protein